MKNKKILQALFIPIALLALSGTCKAQNFTKEVSSLDDFGASIIRTIDNTNWIAYSENSKGHLFYRVPVFGTTVDYLYLYDWQISVTEFVIVTDTVYFCGVKGNEDESCGVVGHFPVSGFPTVSVKYDLFPEVRSFDALDVFATGGHKHIVLVATDPLGRWTMADVRHIYGNSWECNLVDPSGKWYFDDVTVTSGHIIYTSRSFTDKSLSRIWMIDRPAYFGTVIFLSSIYVNDFDNISLIRKFLVTKSMGDGFVTAAKTNDNKILMHQYSMTTYVSSVLFNGVVPFTLKDLVYADVPNSADVLTTTQNVDAVESRIYHIPAMAFEQNMTSNLHRYADEHINSLDVSSDWDSTFVASGFNNTNTCFRVFRYKYDNYSCSTRKLFEIEKKVYLYKEDFPEISVKNYPHDIIEHEYGKENINIATPCGAQSN